MVAIFKRENFLNWDNSTFFRFFELLVV
jgi:hypothetical protein